MSAPSRKSKNSFRGKVAANAQKTTSSGNTVGYLRLPKGVSLFTPEAEMRVKLDFLPYIVTDKNHPDRDSDIELAIEGSQWYRRPFKLHRGIGVNKESIICPTSFGKKCPICEYKTKRGKEGAEIEELKALKASLRNLYIVIPLDSKKHEPVPHIFDISDFLFQEQLAKELKENEEYEVFPSLTEGLTLKVRFIPGTFATKNPYPQADRIDFLERDEQYDDSMLNKVPNLDEVLICLSYDAINNKFFELEDETQEEKEETKPVAKSKKIEEPEEVEENIAEEEDEEEKLTWDDLKGMSQSRLEKFVATNRMDIDVDEYADDVDALRKEIAKELRITVPKPASKKPVCTACQGTGKNSRGNACPICKGTGLAIMQEEQEESKSKPSTNRCPSKLVFGKDTGKDEACDDCDIYNECLEAKRKNK